MAVWYVHERPTGEVGLPELPTERPGYTQIARTRPTTARSAGLARCEGCSVFRSKHAGHCAGCLSGGGEAHEVAARARRAALVVVGPRTMKTHCTGGRPLSFLVKTMVQRASCGLQYTVGCVAWHARARHCTGCLSGRGAARELYAGARRVTLVVVGPCPMEGHCTSGRPPSFVARPWCDVSAAASNPQPAFAWQVRARLCAGCLSGGGAARELVARARRAALLRSIHAPVGGLPPSAPDRGATCQLRPLIRSQLLRGKRERASALAVSPEEAQHVILLLANVVSRWLRSIHALRKGTAPPGGLPPSAPDRGVTCQLWPRLCAAGFRVAKRPNYCARCLSRGCAARELSARAPRAALWSPYAVRKGTAPTEGIYPPSVRDRGLTCQLRPPLYNAGFRVARASAYNAPGRARPVPPTLRDPPHNHHRRSCTARSGLSRPSQLATAWW